MLLNNFVSMSFYYSHIRIYVKNKITFDCSLFKNVQTFINFSDVYFSVDISLFFYIVSM